MQYSAVFELGVAEYGACVEAWLEHQLLSSTSEQAVVILDGNWQSVLKSIANLNILLDEHDISSQKKLRPDFTAIFNGILVMKGEAKATLTDMMASRHELVSKFHQTAHKLFPASSGSIPAVMTCNELISLYSISYFNKRFIQVLIKQYDVRNINGRVEFIVDIFKIIIWIMSQINPVEGFHLAPGVRLKTRNGHHITLLSSGLLKEFDSNKLDRISISTVGAIYALNLPNVEHGTINCTSITITRVGSRLRDAVIVRNMNRQDVYQQVCMGIQQLHTNGFAHCDICVDNIFVDGVEDGGRVFIGDLEYCCPICDPPPTNIRRAHDSALTAEQLDNIQLAKFEAELASIN
jgi:hypothetical protein